MVIYLRHALHGTKVAIAEVEAINDEANGWVRYSLDTPKPPVEPLPEVRRRRKTLE